ncbi:hypothetical protein IS481_02335 [Caldimonas thermodepolymerans]|jgi:hypothetical protein|uniref:Uncharacterized protein n=1 Tax=Caldimonas thermodepolymerans TaxID=215580 RepID=A0A2S5T2A0_9BURK|nr:hypothetical protein [Caldimonas thermodepolymerans]PPE69134.1 hypothetical protein C1702_13895 [Caldimonas thermodepolymerans]QPC32040.1 hypothetical protein IS481_02335 [Caldimonas thermodepolymerans]RDH95949.1 hypothetical protein DES46_11288 [Caldimonas thermodepolymerans]UZG44832.1 hypothetical protein ONZ46_02465 [Caldimonas thermodepolymerans]
MQRELVRERLSFIEQCIDDAALACRETGYAPEELKAWVRELDRRWAEVEAAAGHPLDATSLRACLETLEEIGDRAVEACREQRHIDPQLRMAVHTARHEIAALRRQLH